jgi:hypothetical protein
VKRLLFSLCLISSVFSVNIMSQNNVETSLPKNGDNLILITTNKNAQENFYDFGKYLISKGFSFSKKDLDFLFLETSPKKTGDSRIIGQIQYFFAVSFVDSIIKVKVKFNSLTASTTEAWYDWKCTPMISKVAFNNFDPILREYNNRIVYKKE